MDEQEFKNHAEQAIDDLYRRLSAAAEDYDFEADFNAGAARFPMPRSFLALPRVQFEFSPVSAGGF